MTLACQHVHNVYIFVSHSEYLTLYSFMFYMSLFCRIFFNKKNYSIEEKLFKKCLLFFDSLFYGVWRHCLGPVPKVQQ